MASFWKSLTRTVAGRSAAPARTLDALFAIPDAAITLQTAMNIRPTGVGAVCYRAAEGAAFGETEQRMVALLDSDEGPDVERRMDGFGFTWLIVRTDESVAPLDGMGALATDLHAVNTSLQAEGFDRGLLCSAVAFATSGGEPLALVYRYTTGTFYPFAPTGPQQRNTLLEMQVRTTLAPELRIEPDTGKWMPLWDCPVLS